MARSHPTGRSRSRCGDRDPGQRFVRRIQCGGVESGAFDSPAYDTSLVPSGCSPMGGYAVRGVVRPDSHPRDPRRQGDLVCGPTRRTGWCSHRRRSARTTINWSVMLPLAETVTPMTRWRSTSSAPTSSSTPGGWCHTRASLHELGHPGRRLGRGGVATLATGFGEVGGFSGLAGRPGRNRQRSLLHLAVDVGTRRSSAVERCRGLDFPEGLDTGGRRPDRERHRRRARRWRAGHHPDVDDRRAAPLSRAVLPRRWRR